MCVRVWGTRRWGWPRCCGSPATHHPLHPRRDPDNVTFCVLAADEDDEGDIALQIHFTLIQAFCCENDIDIVRVGDVQRLAAIVGAGGDGAEAGAPGDLHCILISVSGRAPRNPAHPRPRGKPAPLTPLPSSLRPPAESQRGHVERPCPGETQPVLRREPQRQRLGAQHHPS